MLVQTFCLFLMQTQSFLLNKKLHCRVTCTYSGSQWQVVLRLWNEKMLGEGNTCTAKPNNISNTIGGDSPPMAPPPPDGMLNELSALNFLLFSTVCFVTVRDVSWTLSGSCRNRTSRQSELIYSNLATAKRRCTLCSVADPRVYPGSRILIFTHLGSRISDPGSKNNIKREGWKILLSYLLLWPQISQNWKLFYFWNAEEKNLSWANFQKIIELFTQQIVTKLSKLWVRDPGSEIRDPEKAYSGSRILGSKRHRIPDPDPQHELYELIC